MIDYVLWNFVPGHGWVNVDRTRRESRRPDGSVSPALDLAGLLAQRDARLAFVRRGNVKRGRAPNPRAWMVVTPSDVDLRADWRIDVIRSK